MEPLCTSFPRGTTILNLMLIIHSCFHTIPIYAYMHRDFIELTYIFIFYTNSIMQYVFFAYFFPIQYSVSEQLYPET